MSLPLGLTVTSIFQKQLGFLLHLSKGNAGGGFWLLS